MFCLLFHNWLTLPSPHGGSDLHFRKCTKCQKIQVQSYPESGPRDWPLPEWITLSEKEYQEYGKHSKKDYQCPSLSVDAIILNKNDEILLIERKNPPQGWALPGGFVDYGESLEDAITREVKEETDLVVTEANQFRAYSNPARDPRLHVVSMVFRCFVKDTTLAKSGDDAKALKWYPLQELPSLAFDHAQIIKDFNFDFKYWCLNYNKPHKAPNDGPQFKGCLK